MLGMGDPSQCPLSCVQSRWGVRLAKHTSELKKCWMLQRALEKIKLGVGMGSIKVWAVFSRRSRAELVCGDSANLVGQCSGFYSVTPSRKDFASLHPRDRHLAASGEFWLSQLVVGCCWHLVGRQSPGLLMLTSCQRTGQPSNRASHRPRCH